MNCIFIYNPVSGRGKIHKKLNLITKTLNEKYDDVTVYATQYSGDMKRAAREAVGKYDAIIFSGGDGSFNEVLQGIADLDNLPELGYIPSGTVNDIAHTLKIPCNIKKALQVIKTGKNEMLDCMKVNDSYAMYVVAAGAFTSATYNTPQVDKNSVGKLAYYVEGIKHNFNFDFFDIDCKSEKKHMQGMLILFINSRYVSGFKVNELASLQDGKIEATVIQEEKKVKGVFRKFISLLVMAILFLFGRRRVKNKSLIHLEGTSFDVDVADDIVWNFDGEKGCNGKIHVEVVPKKINMIVPQNLKQV
jgi:YegS/Rv2252/BmrU family lipid kinase